MAHRRDLEYCLRQEFGSAPSPRTQEIARRIQRLVNGSGSEPGSAALPDEPAAGLVTSQEPKETPAPSRAAEPARHCPGHLPSPVTRFFGREEEIAKLTELLHPVSFSARSRLVTVTGVGGCGKTRLATEVAARLRTAWPGEIWFVPLADLVDASPLTQTVSQALGLVPLPGADLLAQCIDRLSGAPTLLLLDNFEHLIPEGASQVQILLERVPTLTVLVTSRHLLNLPGERAFALLPLPVPVEKLELRVERPDTDQIGSPELSLLTRKSGPDSQLSILSCCPSVQLFADRAQCVYPQFALGAANAAAVAALCDRLEGLPLALEIAASRANVLTPEQMDAQMADRFRFLESRRPAESRHRSLSAALEWSYRLLSPELQRFFARLSMFRGGWTVEAAQAVSLPDGDPHDPLDLLAQLQEGSLVLSEESGSRMRFRMLETVREFGLRKLLADELAVLARQHAQYYLALATASGLGAQEPIHGFHALLPLEPETLGGERENLRAALTWAVAQDEGLGTRLVNVLGELWAASGYWSEGAAALERILKQDAALPEAVRLAVYAWLALLTARLGDLPRCRGVLEQRLQTFRERGEQRNIAWTLLNLASVSLEPAARTDVETALALFTDLGEEYGVAHALRRLGAIAGSQSDRAAERRYHEEARCWSRSHALVSIMDGRLTVPNSTIPNPQSKIDRSGRSA